MIQQLKALAAFAESWGLVPSAMAGMVSHCCLLAPLLGDTVPPSGLHRYCIDVVHVHTNTYTYKHTSKKIKNQIRRLGGSDTHP